MSQERFQDEDISDYEPSDSDEDYNENEKLLLQKVHNKQVEYSDSEDEVLGVGEISDSEQSGLALSDVGEDEDDLPDTRAWGKDKKKFYATDYVDPDYGGFQGKDANLAELEEEEARNLQQQLAEQLDDDDFSLDFSYKKSDDTGKENEEIVKTDTSKLSKRQSLQILKKESPEFFGLVEDFQSKITLVKDFLNPVLTKYRKGQISSCPAIEFVQTYYELTLNYCTNIYMYLLLKASRAKITSHPIIKRLYQYRQLMEQLSPIYEDVIRPQINILLEEDVEMPQQPKKLEILSKLTKANKRKSEVEKPAKKVKFNEVIEEVVEPEEPIEEAIEEIGKRGITYQIAKNKGLTPYRKKEQRNPRVKHRNKYRKAKIRRKGAVREPRTELTRYSGEISGIKASVCKSIKIKS